MFYLHRHSPFSLRRATGWKQHWSPGTAIYQQTWQQRWMEHSPCRAASTPQRQELVKPLPTVCYLLCHWLEISSLQWCLQEKTLRTPVKILIVNMAISDLLYSIIRFPLRFLRSNTASHWPLSGPLDQALCRLTYFATDVSSAVSIQSLVLIAVDRFVAVVFPLRPSLISSKQCRLSILVIWIVAMVVSCPNLTTWKFVENPEGLVCRREWKDKFRESSSIKNDILVTIIVFIYVPLVLIAILYFSIAVRIKSQKIPAESSVNARKQRLKRERNVLKMSIAIVFVSAVCWLPFSILFLVFLFTSDSVMMSSCAFQYSAHITVILARSYCAVNPCICFIFSGNYRQGLKNLLGCFSTNKAALT